MIRSYLVFYSIIFCTLNNFNNILPLFYKYIRTVHTHTHTHRNDASKYKKKKKNVPEKNI